MCGKTPYWGNHVPAQRKANILIQIDCPTETVYDWDSVGFAIGRQCPIGSIPALSLKNTHGIDTDRLRSAFASMATTGGVELCHILGVTPEAETLDMAFGGKQPQKEISITEKDVAEVREFLSDACNGDVDYVHLGCPHYSLEQIAAVARFLEGRKIKDTVTLHIWTAPAIKFLADENGFTRTIEKAGGRLLTGSCALVSGKLPDGVKTIAFDSAKQANPQHSFFSGSVLYGSREQCLEAAVTGKWRA
jgi:predicted aconitase